MAFTNMKLSFNTIDEMYAAVGFGSINLKQIIPRWKNFIVIIIESADDINK